MIKQTVIEERDEAHEALRKIVILCGNPDPSDGEGTTPEEVVGMVEALTKKLITPNTKLPPLADGQRRKMLITIEVSEGFEKRLDNQWEVEREIHADRWSWRWEDEGLQSEVSGLLLDLKMLDPNAKAERNPEWPLQLRGDEQAVAAFIARLNRIQALLP